MRNKMNIVEYSWETVVKKADQIVNVFYITDFCILDKSIVQ